MKTDARVRYTRKILKETLLKLLEQKPINRITVKEVCERSELNRATFYAHYSDCFDLLEQIENDLLEAFRESLSYLDGLDISKMAEAIYDMIDGNLELCRVLIFPNPNAAILRKMIDVAHDSSLELWRKNLKSATEAEMELLFVCLSNGMLHVVVEGYEKYDRATLIGFMNRMVQRSLSAYR